MHKTTEGTIAIIIPFILWGLFPIYWKSLEHINPTQLLAHRIVWSFIFVVLLLTASRQWKKSVSIITTYSDTRVFIATSFLIGVNWLTYIWAVNSDQIVEASLGYFINPLVNVFLGIVSLRERLNRWQVFSVLLASFGLIFLTWKLGRVPWIALILAFTLGTYGLLRKIVIANSMTGLFIETAILTPFALTYLINLSLNGANAFDLVDLKTDFLLIGSGLITAVTLLLFVYGARRLQYSTVGFLQYIIPTLKLLLGVFLYEEPFTLIHTISFGFVWTAILIYLTSSVFVGKEPSA